MSRYIRLNIVRQLAALAIVCSLVAVAAAPASAVAAAIALNPNSGPGGTAVTVTATNFAPYSVLTAKFDGTPLVTAPATVTTFSDGGAAFAIVISSATAGVHTITVSDSVNIAAADFIVLHGPKPAQNWAVIVGVNDYPNLSPLQYAVNDAQDIYNRLTGTGWQPANIQILLNGNATKADIQNAINWMGTHAASQDLCLFFFSGHGSYGPDVAPIDETDGYDEYLCPYDSLSYSWDNDIRDDELDAWLSPITARKVVIIDACYSGGFFKGAAKYTVKAKSDASYTVVNNEPADGFAKDINKTGFMALTACDYNETSAEYGYPLWNGVFTYYLNEGLGGPADVNGNGVSAEEAFAYAAPRVQSYVLAHSGIAQDPQLWDGISGEVIFTPYTLTINSTAGGSVIEPGTGIFTFDPGTVADLLALPDTGYKFVNWTGYVGTVDDSYAADTTITMNSNYAITANFAEVRPPTVITTTATNVTSSSATLNGTLYNLGSATSVQVSFEWGNTTNYGNETPEQTESLPTVFSADISGLTPGTTYHFKARAVGDSTAYGFDMTVTTKAPPSVITNATGDITADSAILNGNLTAMGTAASVTVSFEWGNTTSYGNETPVEVLNAPGAFSDNITGLSLNTTYHFRAKAVGDGTSYGNDTAFTTSTLPPSVITNAAGNITADSAILNGNLTAMGTATSVTVSFEWGNTTSYGNETPAEVLNVLGVFSGNITGLNSNTTYHFRAKAVGDGTSYGNDTTFIVAGLVVVTGITREIKGAILPGVSITLDGIGPVVSDQDGQFQITDTAIGNHTIVAHKDGFRDRTRTVNIAPGQGSTVTCNFQGQSGLIPNAPDRRYALDCINLWLYPPNPDTGLDIWTALDVINAWLYPMQ
jgi:hypothetical protein